MADAQWWRQKVLARRAKCESDDYIPPEPRDILWTPLDWKLICQNLASLCSPSTQSFLNQLGSQESLSKKQWETFKIIHAEKLGPTEARMLSVKPVKPKIRENVQIEPEMVTRYKLRQTGKANVIKDQDGFIQHWRKKATRRQVDADGFIIR